MGSLKEDEIGYVAISPPQETMTATNVRFDDDYWRLRDFEYAQPLYDLAFVLEIEARALAQKSPEYRTFALWKAAIALDSYGTIIDRWLDGTLRDESLDQVPSDQDVCR